MAKNNNSPHGFVSGEFNPPKAEEKVLKFWETNRIFEKSLEKTKKGKPFTFYDGPPFATGLPHYGHILASTIKDVVPRYQTMRGRFVRRRWGWDCHGLPIEEIVERKLGISGKKQIEEVGIKKFNETCRSMVLECAEEWGKMVRRIARWVEFKDSYKTMDTDYMESVWWAFKKIHEKGLVYEGRKVLLYCPRCETPVSNFEVAMDNSYQEVDEESVTVKFKLKRGQRVGEYFTTDDSTYVLSWTTTPWTLPGNVAIAVGGKIKYALLKKMVNGRIEKWFVAENIVRSGLNRIYSESDIREIIDGKDLVGLKYEPLFDLTRTYADYTRTNADKLYRIYAADFVTTGEGTGVVHTAIVYGEDDYKLGLREGLPVVPLLDEKGIFNKDAPEFLRGIYFKDSEKIIKKNLEERHLLLQRKMHRHSYPYCWRCGSVLFYNAIPAWFINIQKIKSKLISSNRREINWFPEHLKRGRYEKSVEAAPDWNISRNRYWGNPIPAWKCKSCGHNEIIGSLEELSQAAGGPRNRYWVMRHGESETQLTGVIDSGRGKFHLTPRGRNQIANSVKTLMNELAMRGEKINLVISSDVLRARESENVAASILNGGKLLTDERLHEINLGELSGRYESEYHKFFPTYESKFEKRPKGGESLRDVRARVWEFLAECEKKYKGKNILLVSHEYPIWMIFQAAEGWSEKKAIRKKIKKGADFINVGEARKLDFKIAPRNDGGEVDLHRPYVDEVVFTCGSCGKKMKRTTEIFDSWVEAGSMPFAGYHYPFENKDVFESRLPAQFVAEYIAQTRAWFYVMHVISLILFGKAPFENVVTTGTILAEDGSKMSKSKANFPDPNIVIGKYGADSLRFYLMNSVVMQADNLNFSEKGVEGVFRKVGLLLRNVYNYFKTYAPQGTSRGKGKNSSGNVLDAWIKIKTERLVTDVTNSLDNYDTVSSTRAIQDYIDGLSTWYLRRSRKRRDRAFFDTLYECLMKVSKVIAPFMPFLADELYLELKPQSHGRETAESVHLTDWPEVKLKIKDERLKILTKQMAEVRRLASLGLAKRAEAGIKVRQPLRMLKVKSEMLKGGGGKGEKLKVKLSKELLAILAEEVNVKEVAYDKKIKDEIELDTTITPALKEEGILREVVRTVQDLRQKAGLKPKDKIALMAVLPAEVRLTVYKNERALKKQVGAESIEYKKSEKFEAEANTKIDGAEIWLGVRKV
jgi:isoleucyl-tRNA synthetase